MNITLRHGAGIPDSDCAMHAKMLDNPENSRYLEVRWNLPQSTEQCRAWITNPFHWYIYADDKMAGTIGATINRYNNYATLGYFIDVGYRMQGIGRSAVDFVLEHLRGEGVLYIECGVLECNLDGLIFLDRMHFDKVGVESGKMRSPAGGRCGRVVFGRKL